MRTCLHPWTYSVALCLAAIAAPQRGTAAEFNLLQDLGTSPGFRALVQTHTAPQQLGTDGAVGRNKRAFVDVAEQRGALWFAMRGVMDNNPQAMDAAIQALEYGFAHQNPAGYFENALDVDPRRAVEADAFFLQAAARVALLVQASPFQAQFQARLSRLHPPFELAMRWLAQNQQELLRQDHNAVNRLWFDAMAFKLSGLYLHDAKLQQIGQDFVTAGLQGQRAAGSFNEHKGADTSYQAVSILNVAVLLSQESDVALAQRLKASLLSATQWEAARISDSG